MQDLVDQLLTYAKGIWVRKWYVVICAWIVCIVGWPIVMKMPNTYESRAQVHVDTKSLLKPILRGLTLQTNPEQEVQLMVRTLLTRPNLEKIARLTDLDLRANTPAEMDGLISSLRSKISIRHSRAGRENLYTIGYSSNDPVLAKNVVQATLTTLVENTLGGKRSDQDTATSFLEEQIADYETRLIEAENRLKEFKRRNVGLTPGSQGSYYSRLEQTKAQLRDVELAYEEAEIRYQSLRNQLINEEARARAMSDSQVKSEIVTSYDSRIDQMERELDQLRLKFTDQHPDIKESQRVLVDLKQRRAEERDSKYKELLASGAQQTAVYQELKFATAQAEAEMKSLAARAENHRIRLQELEEKVNTVPEIEAELTALNRDYDITQNKYNELLNRRESARLGQKADVSSDSFQFRVVDPPLVPTSPSGPNRMLYLTAIIAFGVALGAGIAFLISQLRPIFFSSKQLHDVTGLPVLGTVTKLHSAEVIKATRRNGLFFIAAVASLVVLYAILVGIQLNPDLHQSFSAKLPDFHSILSPILSPIMNIL